MTRFCMKCNTGLNCHNGYNIEIKKNNAIYEVSLLGVDTAIAKQQMMSMSRAVFYFNIVCPINELLRKQTA